MNPPEYTNIRDLKASMKNLTMMFIVLEMGRPNVTKKGHEVRTCKIADKTGSVNISLWDEIGKVLQPGDICKLVKGYASLWKGCLTLYTGEKGEITKVGEFCMVFAETPNMSEPVTESQSALKPDSRSSSPTSQLTSSASHSTPSSSGQSGENSRGPAASIGGNGHYAIQGFPSSGGLQFQRNNHTPRPRSGSDASSTRVSLLNHNNGNSNNGTSNGSNNGSVASNTHNSNTSNNNNRRRK